MKTSERLFSKAKEAWEIAAEKSFVLAMAKGTLDQELFKRYMMQDYLYLLEYTKIITRIRDISEDEEMTAFLNNVIIVVEEEIKNVHQLNLEKLGTTDDDIKNNTIFPVITEYTGFMSKCVDELGAIGGFTSLLQCSWVYAYIAEKAYKNYPDEIAGSQYGSWFEAYVSEGYLTNNQMWIDLLDKKTEGLDETTIEKLCTIFNKCALYENDLWDALFE